MGELTSLDMIGFKPIDTPEFRERFLSVLDRFEDVFSPETVEYGRRRIRKVPYREFKLLAGKEGWALGITFHRTHPLKITGFVDVVPREASHDTPNRIGLYMRSRAAHHGHLARLVDFGSALYELMSACCGFITLPWLDNVRGVDPLQGLPGLGWATWLGPEYAQFVPPPSGAGLHVENLPDGGLFIHCGFPDDIMHPDPRVVNAYELLLSQVDSRLLQTNGSAKQVPKFRFHVPQDRGMKRDVGPGPNERLYGPLGFTRRPEIRVILDKVEPKTLEGGVPNNVGGAVRFWGLTPNALKELLGLLPAEQADDSLEYSPTLREMVEVGRLYPNARFFGFRVVPENPGERITIEGFTLPATSVTDEIRQQIEALGPNRVDWVDVGGQRVLFVEWE